MESVMAIRLLIRVGVAVLILAVMTGCRLEAQSIEGMFDRTVAVSGPVTLDIRTGSGSISIHSGPVDSVRVIARIRARSLFGGDHAERIRRIEAAPPIEHAGNAIRIGHVDDDRLFRNITISYDVSVPPDTRGRSHTGSGGQTLENFSGPLDVAAGSGHLVIRHIGSDVRASTGSGAIQIEDIGGNVVGRTGSGSITAQRVGGAVDVHTGSGRVEVTQTAEADVEVVTGSGSIGVRGARRAVRARAGSGRIDLEGRPGQNWDIESASGSVRIDFADDAAFELNARTASGGITTDHPLTVLESTSRRRLRGTVRGGGAKVDVSTASGSIHIE
jgi:hypothetical protein